MRTETAQKKNDDGEWIEFSYEVPETKKERQKVEQKQNDGEISTPMNLATNLDGDENQ